MCRPRRNENALAFQRPAARIGEFGEVAFNGRENFRGLRHPPRSIFPAGHVALIGAHEIDAIGKQRLEIALGCGMQPHPHIHRRRNQHLLVGRKQRRARKIVRKPMRHLRHEIGGRRRDDKQVRISRQLDMAHLRLIGQAEKIGIDLVASEARNRKRRHELLCGLRQDRAYGGAALAQAADEFKAFIGRDAAAYDQQHAPSLEECVAQACLLTACRVLPRIL